MSSFSDLSLSAPLLRAVEELGFQTPSPIQAQTLPILLGEPTDFLGLAATGTGKTAAFSIPLLEQMEPKSRRVQGLVLCPTRELALQVAGQINLLGKFKGVRAVAVYGGASYYEQIEGLKSGATVVVGTPGRVCDHLDRGTLRIDELKTLVLDEADEMISMGFKEDLEKVLKQCPRDVAEGVERSQIWLFSATMSKEVRRVADVYLETPQRVEINRTEVVPSTIEQLYYPVMESNKPEVLCKLIEAAEDFYGLVFCQTKALVQDLTDYLNERGYRVDCLHGDKDQNARERTMLAFRERKVKILICTDVASRGLDVKDITHVINYSLPRELDNYVHRIGRTARSGKTGTAMNLVTRSHQRLIFEIEKMTKSKMVEGKLPTRREIASKKVSSILPKFNDQPFHARAVEVMSEEWKELLQGLTAEEVASRFITMLMPDVFNDSERRDRQPMNRTQAPRVPASVQAAAAMGGGERFERRNDDRRDDRRNDNRDERRNDRREFSRGGDERRDPRVEGGAGRAPRGEFNREERRSPFQPRFDRGGERPARAGRDFEPRGKFGRERSNEGEQMNVRSAFKQSREQKQSGFGDSSPVRSESPARHAAAPDGMNRRARRALKFANQAAPAENARG